MRPTWNQILGYRNLWLMLAVLVILRLPALDRPLSKHHEYNTAAVLINAISWQQAGGGSVFSFTPLMNFQGQPNKVLESGPHVDRAGNHVYLSFGPGWYLLPYVLFNMGHIDPSPMALECLSIGIGLLTIVLFFGRLWQITGQRTLSFRASLLFCLLPAPLWYMGTAYVTTAIMLPLVVEILWRWHLFSRGPEQVTARRLLMLFVLGVALTYTDWLTPFILGAMGLWAMWRIRTHRRYGWLVACCAITTVAGILLVLAQFAHYLGWPQVMAYWQSRLGDRSMNTSDHGWTGLALGIARNAASGYLPLIGLIAWAWWRSRPVLIREHRWVMWALSGVLVYNGLFLNWSAVHEFAGMALALVGTLAMALFSSQTFLNPRPWPIVLAALASVAIYFYINMPGPRSWKGDAYASQQQLGEAIAQNVDADAVIFTNLVNDKIVEYYARRTFNPAHNYSHAQHLTDSLKPGQAVWLDIQDGKIETLRPLH